MRAWVASLATAILGAAVLVAGWVHSPRHVAVAWHAAATFGLTMSLGGFLVGAVLSNAGATWSATIRRVHDAIGGALPIACLAYVPLLGGSGHLLDIVYMLTAVAFEEVMRSASLRNDVRRTAVGAVGLVVVSLAMTAFFFDVTMAPARPWVSDIFGLYILVGSFGCAVGATAFAAARMRTRLRVTREHASALGRVELVATCLWAYAAFALYMLIWIADLPREVSFFIPRTAGAWAWLALVLIVARFLVPFLLLLPRAPKRSWTYIGVIGALGVMAHALDCELLVVPSSGASPSALDIGPFLLVGGACAFVASLRFGRHEPLPASPEVERALGYEAS